MDKYLSYLEADDEDVAEEFGLRRNLQKLQFKLESFVREAREQGIGIPERTDIAIVQGEGVEASLARADLVAIAAQVQHSPATDLLDSPFSAIILQAVGDLGLMKPSGPPTIADLREDLIRRNGFESTDLLEGDEADLQIAIEILDDLLATFLLPASTDLSAVFGSEATVNSIKATLVAQTKGDQKADRTTSIDRLARHALSLIRDRSMPATFSGRLKAMAVASGQTIAEIAKASGVNVKRLRDLMSGSQPRLDMAGVVARLENVLGAPPNTLWSLVEAPRMRIKFDDVYTREVAKDFKVVGVHSDFLPPDWDKLTKTEKEKIVAWIYRHAVLGTPYRRLMRAGYEEHQELPPIMEAELAKITEFKTVKLSPMNWHDREMIILKEFQGVQHGGKWKNETPATARNYVLRTLTAVKGICEDPNNAWADASGLGFLIHPECQLRACEKIARTRYARLKAARAFDRLSFKEPEDGLVFAHADVARLESILSFFNPTTGYLFHHPPKLAPIPGLIDESWVLEAINNWQTTVKECRIKLRRLINQISDLKQKIRDPWLPIEPILQRDQPLTPILQALDQMEAERPSFFGTPMVAGRHDRDHVVMSLLVHGRLRRANYNKITWRTDNTGNLRWDAGGFWKLVIPQKDMKNEGSAALPAGGADLILVLDPEDRRLYKAIERWIGAVDPTSGLVDEFGSSRRLLHGDRCCDFLFPGRDESDGISEDALSKIVNVFSSRYLVGRPWSERGIMGVVPFGSHALRDIVATHILKNTGSLEDAAAALFDSIETLKRHYARFTSEQRSVRINSIVRTTTSR